MQADFAVQHGTASGRLGDPLGDCGVGATALGPSHKPAGRTRDLFGRYGVIPVDNLGYVGAALPKVRAMLRDLTPNCGAPMLILVVEDDPLVALSLSLCLAGAGHAVLGPADRATTGLDLARQHRPDLALLDIQLRDGHTGGALARELHGLGIPCLFTSADALEARRNQDVALGLVVKPYEPQAVLDAVLLADDLANGRPPRKRPAGLERFEGGASAPALMDGFPVLGAPPPAAGLAIGPVAAAAPPADPDAAARIVLEPGAPD